MPPWLRLFIASASGTLLVLPAPAIHAVDCNQNRVEDVVDVETGASADCNRNLVPDECDVLPVSYGLVLDREVPMDQRLVSLLATDLDGDGSPDLAAFFELGSRIRLLWNDGAGGFGETTDLNVTEDFPGLLRSLDLEGDGDPDLLISAETVSFFQNDGNRAFSRGPKFRLDFPVLAIAPGDLDLDGDVDLAVAGPFKVSVLRRATTGAFEESQTFPIGSGPRAIAVVDLDGDHDLDIATGNSFENVSILINDGSGLFAFPRNHGAGGAVGHLETADMNGDGDRDLITIFSMADGRQGMSVLENAGDGSFRAGASVPITTNVVAVFPRDVDADGDLDLIFPAMPTAFIQNHGGVLSPVELFPLDVAPSSAAAADLDGDGSIDIVEAHFQDSILAVLERVPWRNRPDCNGDGVPDDCQLAGKDCNGNSVPDDCDIASGASRDCNANGTPDECEHDCNKNAVPDDCDLARGTTADCNGNSIPDECDLLPQVHVEPGAIDRASAHISLQAADLDGDRDLDLVTTVMSQAIRSFLNSGNGSFEAADQPLFNQGSIVLVADIEGDGDPDLVLRGAGFIVMTNDGKGRFEKSLVVSPVSTAISGGDLDGDGDLDLVLGEPRIGAAIHLFTGKEFELAADLISDQGISSLVTGDFDSDGDLDVAGVLEEASVIRTFLNDGAAGFPSVRDSRGGNINSIFTVADLDGDGDLDLAEQSRTASVRLDAHINQGDGRFADPLPIRFEPFVGAVAASDLDGDGDVDLAVGTAIGDFNCAPGSGLTFLMNDGSAGFAAFQGPLLEPLSIPFAVVAGDLDGDGLDDVAMLAFPQCPCCIGPTQTSIHVILNRTIPAPSRDRNHNRLPDECEGPSFRRGDASADGRFDITDAVLVLLHLFQGGPAPVCSSSADSNDDGKIDVTDPIHFLGWLFAAGPPPPHPGAACGHDPDPPGAEGNLGCAAYEGC